MKNRIAITGVIGTGKTTLRKIIESLGYPVCDVDDINRLLQVKQTTLDHLSLLFGRSVCKNGMIDKDVLRSALKDQKSKEQLENYLHPLILVEMNEFLKQHEGQLCFVEVPLLYEVGWEIYFDEVWCLFVDESILITRLQCNRGYSKEQIEMFFQLQMSQREKCNRSTKILDNSTSKENLEYQVKKFLKEVMYE